MTRRVAVVALVTFALALAVGPTGRAGDTDPAGPIRPLTLVVRLAPGEKRPVPFLEPGGRNQTTVLVVRGDKAAAVERKDVTLTAADGATRAWPRPRPSSAKDTRKGMCCY